MYKVAVRRKFTAFHHLIGGDWGPENTHHSHDYVLEVVCLGPKLDQHQYLFDISVLERHLEALIAKYSGNSLNELPGFEGKNPSIELFCAVISKQLEPALHMGDGFHIGGALDRPGAGLLPVAHGLVVAPGFGVVVCQEFRLGCDDLWKPSFE